VALTSPLSPPVPQQSTRLLSVLQFTLSSLAIAFLWISAPVLVFVGLISIFMQDSLSDSLSVFLLATAMVSCGLLLLPSAYYALRNLQGKPAVDILAALRKTQPALWIFILPVVLLVGYFIQSSAPLKWLLLPLLHVAAAGLPIGWLLYLAVRELPIGSMQRVWGAFSSGLVLAPVIVSVLEILAAFGFILAGAFYLVSHPDVLQRLSIIAQWIGSTQPGPEQILERYSGYLVRREAIAVALLFAALIVPLIEEIFKPVGVWLLAGNRLSPAAGFAAGALGGAGFALFESIMLTSNNQEWISLMVARIGTSAVHILTAAVTGWALTYALRTGNYLRLGLAYLGAVALHAVWNGLTVLVVFATLAASNNLTVAMPFIPLETIAKYAPFGLIFLAIASFLALFWSNRALVQSLRNPQAPPADLAANDLLPEDAEGST
jgi:hypothetical protein